MVSTVDFRYRSFSPWSFGLAISAVMMSIAVFAVTQSVKQRESAVDDLSSRIISEQQTLRVLDAEWAYLTRPQRIEDLMALKDGTADHAGATAALQAGQGDAQAATGLAAQAPALPKEATKADPAEEAATPAAPAKAVRSAEAAPPAKKSASEAVSARVAKHTDKDENDARAAHLIARIATQAGDADDARTASATHRSAAQAAQTKSEADFVWSAPRPNTATAPAATTTRVVYRQYAPAGAGTNTLQNATQTSGRRGGIARPIVE